MKFKLTENDEKKYADFEKIVEYCVILYVF